MNDREAKLRGILHLNGSGILAYWLGMFICDLLLFLLPTCLFLILIKVMKLTIIGSIGGIFLTLFGFGLSLLPFTYLIQFIFDNVTQAIKCVLPGYLLFGTALPLTLAVIIAAISNEFRDNEFYLFFAMGLLYVTTPMFTFYITFVSIIINYFSSRFSYNRHENYIPLFAQGMMAAEPVTGFICFCCQSFVFFCLVLLIDWRRMNAFRRPEPIKPDNVPPKLQQNVDIIKHEERVHNEMDNEYLIKAQDVFKTYESGVRTQAVGGVTFGVKKGETLGLLGPNGAGKSSVFSVIALQEPQSFGKVTLLQTNTDIINLSRAGKRIGMCPQYNSIMEQLTVMENL